ncbi:MAG: ribonuclease H-like domain-containing protein [Eubacteriales bacterium]|nr:ribonuclease H-like domain-containing protein [Eubacteriales bacterium]
MDIGNLRDRLRKAGASSAKRAEPKPAAGLVIRECSREADERLYRLAPEALRRIGCAQCDMDIEKALFLDTETTGLSGGVGTVAFLVGLGWIRDGVFHVRQILMKDYASEGMLIEEMARASEGFLHTISFNGRTFDLPLLETRCTMNRRRSPYSKMECIDLLTPARRLWRRRLGSVRLARLEEQILGQGREGDLPGSEAPQRYFDYLKTGDFALLEEVIDHNRQDILSMGALLAEICEVYGSPRRAKETADLLSLGLALGRQGEKAEAEALYRMAAEPKPVTSIQALSESGLRAQAAKELDRLLRREGRKEERIELLRRLCTSREGALYAHTELAKIYEHEYKDYRAALRAAGEALRHSAQEDEREQARRRIERLEKKIAKSKGENAKCLF